MFGPCQYLCVKRLLVCRCLGQLAPEEFGDGDHLVLQISTVTVTITVIGQAS